MKNYWIGALLCAFLVAACGGKETMASKSADAYREAVAKGTPVGGGDGHAHHAPATTTSSPAVDHSTMDHSAHGATAPDSHAGMDHSAQGAATADHSQHSAASADHAQHRATSADHSQHRATSVEDRKSTRLNSSHGYISYAVFCLKKKKSAL